MNTLSDVGAVRPFEDMPVIDIPDNYATEMPTFLAKTALEHGPIFRRELPQGFHARFGRWTVYMIGPEANRFVLQTHREYFSHDQGWTPHYHGRLEKGLLNTDDPEHDRDRRMMNPAFAVAYMNRYLPIMNRIIEERTADWAERDTVDLYTEARGITFKVAAETLLGFHSLGEIDRLRDLFFRLLRVHNDANVRAQEEAIAQIRQVRLALDDMLLSLIADRRLRPTDDILGMLVQSRDDEGRPFTDKQLLGQVHILLLAGHETTTTMAAWTLYLLASHPQYLKRVVGEINAQVAQTGGEVTLKTVRTTRLLGYAMSEAGRLRSPVGHAPRGVLQDVEFGGYSIPADTRLLLSLAGGHRLPNVFAHPEAFDPDRFAPPREEDRRHPYAFVPFGGGPRICIGINFAQVQIKAMAAHILRKYALQPVPGQHIQHIYYGPLVSIPTGIHVTVIPRAAASGT
jgi:retinoid hydroxylase